MSTFDRYNRGAGISYRHAVDAVDAGNRTLPIAKTIALIFRGDFSRGIISTNSKCKTHSKSKTVQIQEASACSLLRVSQFLIYIYIYICITII